MWTYFENKEKNQTVVVSKNANECFAQINFKNYAFVFLNSLHPPSFVKHLYSKLKTEDFNEDIKVDVQAE